MTFEFIDLFEEVYDDDDDDDDDDDGGDGEDDGAGMVYILLSTKTWKMEGIVLTVCEYPQQTM